MVEGRWSLKSREMQMCVKLGQEGMCVASDAIKIGEKVGRRENVMTAMT